MHIQTSSDEPLTPTDTTSPPAADPPISNKSMFKVAFASLMGTVIEFYDYLIYATAAALVFSDVFFPPLVRVPEP